MRGHTHHPTQHSTHTAVVVVVHVGREVVRVAVKCCLLTLVQPVIHHGFLSFGESENEADNAKCSSVKNQ